MVDYTKPTMRDESWRRWKGGKKLADELRTFYTAKHVFGRIAAQNSALGPSGTRSANGEVMSATRREAMAAFLGGHKQGQQGGWPGIVARGAAAAAAATANTGLPGQTGPKR